MPGAQPKSQHFVQRAYLEAFCDPASEGLAAAPFLWVHAANQNVRRQIPKECAVENYFYCFEQDGKRSFKVETMLAELEDASSDVLKAAQQGILPNTIRDRFTLTGYVAMSLVRTQASKNHIDQTAIDHTSQGILDLINDPVKHVAYCADLERETGIKHDPEEQRRKLRAGKVRWVQTNRAWSLKRMAELMMHFQKLFMQMHLSVLHAESRHFLTSDCPVRVHDPATAPLLPKGYNSFEMLFPLSREFCLIGSYSKHAGRMEMAETHVKNMNLALARQAERFVFAPFNDDYIQTELRKSFAQRPPTEKATSSSFDLSVQVLGKRSCLLNERVDTSRPLSSVAVHSRSRASRGLAR
jgi:hypothetical protein